MTEGLMILAPMGTGKSFWISVYNNYSDKFVDGDTLLKKRGVKNRNSFWYDQSKTEERKAILGAFEPILKSGISILYSGNPYYFYRWERGFDIMIIPDKKTRRERLAVRDGFIPTEQQIKLEDIHYSAYDNLVRYRIQGDIPRPDVLLAIQNNIKRGVDNDTCDGSNT